MADEIVLNKAAVIERCLARIAEEYHGHENELERNYTIQDAIILNLLRASEAAIDLAMHIVRVGHLGLPQDSREAFTLLEQAGRVDTRISQRMQAMVGFRNIAVHDYQKLSLPIVRNILEHHLDDFRAFSSAILSSSEDKDKHV